MDKPRCAPVLYTARLSPDGPAFPAPADHPLLHAAEAAGLTWPSSCRNGTCRVCIAHLASGQVHYLIPWPGLSVDEKDEGAILPCVAYPCSNVILRKPGS
jgi:ferredoxin